MISQRDPTINKTYQILFSQMLHIVIFVLSFPLLIKSKFKLNL